MLTNELFNSVQEYVIQSQEDLMALAWFLFCCYGYTYIVDNFVHSSSGLSARMHLYRVQWMTMTLTRENRVVDANIVNGIHQNVAFFASSSVLIIAGFIAILGYTETAMDILRQIPFADVPTIAMWYTKIGVMISLFVYAFFKFTWSLRQLNYCNILIGAMPKINDSVDEYIPAARRAAMVLTMGARDMNRGVRIFSFAMTCLCWFVSHWFFMMVTGIVVWVLYRREFKSDIVKVLNMPSEEKILLSEIEQNTITKE